MKRVLLYVLLGFVCLPFLGLLFLYLFLLSEPNYGAPAVILIGTPILLVSFAILSVIIGPIHSAFKKESIVGDTYKVEQRIEIKPMEIVEQRIEIKDTSNRGSYVLFVFAQLITVLLFAPFCLHLFRQGEYPLIAFVIYVPSNVILYVAVILSVYMDRKVNKLFFVAATGYAFFVILWDWPSPLFLIAISGAALALMGCRFSYKHVRRDKL